MWEVYRAGQTRYSNRDRPIHQTEPTSGQDIEWSPTLHPCLRHHQIKGGVPLDHRDIKALEADRAGLREDAGLQEVRLPEDPGCEGEGNRQHDQTPEYSVVLQEGIDEVLHLQILERSHQWARGAPQHWYQDAFEIRTVVEPPAQRELLEDPHCPHPERRAESETRWVQRSGKGRNSSGEPKQTS